MVDTATTYATSYTPKGGTRLPAGKYTWSIAGSSTKGPGSLRYTNSFEISGNLPTSGAAALTPLTPTASTPGIVTVPSLTWEPMAGAAYYKVSIGNASDTNQVLVRAGVRQPAGPGRALPGHDGDLEPRDARRSVRLAGRGLHQGQRQHGRRSGGPLHRAADRCGDRPRRRTGRTAARTRTIIGPKNPCTQSTGQCSVPATPVLKWTADPRVAYYMVYVSEDSSFTNILEPENAIPATANSMYAPALDNDDSTYADNQAGQAYYWHIRPCRNPRNCGPDPMSENDLAQGSFTKRSPAVTGLTSSDPAGGEITFSLGRLLRLQPGVHVGADRRAQPAGGQAVPHRGVRSTARSSTASSWTRRPTPPPTGSTPRARWSGGSRPSTPTTTASPGRRRSRSSSAAPR